MTSLIGYHVTPARNTASILESGLFAEIGPRSEDIGESSPAVYLFPTLDHLTDGLGNWLGEYFEDEDELSVFAVDYSGLRYDSISVGFEVMVHEDIPADRVTVIDYPA